MATERHGYIRTRRRASLHFGIVTAHRIGFAECVSSAYQIAPLFLIRMAGVPFEAIHQLATPDTSDAARALIAEQENAKNDSNSQLTETLERELARARVALWESARGSLGRYLVFAMGGVRELHLRLLRKPSGDEGQDRRNSRAGDRERHLLLYLQRVAAKNDTFGDYGPTGWGKVDSENTGEANALRSRITIDVAPGIAEREAFLERWTAHGIAAAMNADPAVRSEICPRLHPNCRIDGDRLVFADRNETTQLDAGTKEILMRCDGSTPPGQLGIDLIALEQMAGNKMILWEIEVPALDVRAFNSVVNDVKNWHSSSIREKWLGQLLPIAASAERFGETSDPVKRLEIMNKTGNQLDQIGAKAGGASRFLYSAKNPIGEECFRNCGFTISQKLIDEVAVESEPWIDLWRDCYAFIANRVAGALRQILDKAQTHGPMPFPAFLRSCEEAKLPLTGPGLIAPAVIAFQEIKAAFRERLRPHADLAEYKLTAEDCHIVRNNFSYDRFDEYTFPSADLQLSAESIDAVESGNYRWLLAELHPPAAFLQHCMYWACPDKPALTHYLTCATGGRPNFYFGFLAADFTAHTTVQLFDALPQMSNFVAVRRGNPKWRAIPPSQTEVYIDESNQDVCLRTIDGREHLGSFARNWIIPLGFHPFQFGVASHTPRLRCGNVIVQRRAWTVTLDELGAGNFKGVSRDLVVAMEKLRARRDLPRYIYIRPTEQALRRSGAEGRDKDTKPVFVDLESYLFLEIFHRWLTKAGELEVAEMLPDPDHLLWREADGRRTFELRTLIVPRS